MGYVGLCTAATFASKGIRSTGIDIDQERIDQIHKGKTPIHEPQLDSMLRKAVKKKLLNATTDTSTITKTDITFLTVGTPSQPDGSIDLSYIKKATESIGTALKEKTGYHTVVVKSTVVPGTTNGTVKPILEKTTNKTIGEDLGLAANPEFLAEGTAIRDALHPDKIVIGSNDQKSSDQLIKLYKQFHRTKLPPVLLMTPESAELVKYANNAFLATKVSFINTIANIAEQTPGVDVNKIAEAIGHDPRIGPLFLKAGPGYGGSCFHKDLQALISYSKQHDYIPELLQATEQVNENQARRVVEKAEKLLGTLKNKRIAILGLSFKKDTDDIREAASLKVIDQLRDKGAKIIVYDPMAISQARRLLEDRIDYAESARSAIRGSDCTVIMTEWDQFRELGPRDFQRNMKIPNILDARRIYDPREFKYVNYHAIGLGIRPSGEPN
jgi:UDPglucose 6-dehydrogenase